MPVLSRYWIYGLLLMIWSGAATICAGQDDQQSTAPEQPLPEIADVPKTVDPATLLSAELAVPVTVDFSDSSLREILDWLRNEQDLVVLVENSSLSNIGVSLGEPISDRLDNTPLYLLLNRLRLLNLAWYFEDDILHITSSKVANQRLTTLPYNIRDLLDSGFELDDLDAVIETTIDLETWDAAGGVGVVSSLGDVMFIRQTDEVQKKVEGLFAALRNHARQTFILDPPQHLLLRKKLKEKVSVNFLDTPLVDAVEQLAGDSQIDIRLDAQALRQNRVREREPVTLRLNDRTLTTVLQAMVLDLKLTWILRDGVLWITSADRAESFLKTAVYDVRDLCRDEAESDALRDAVISQTGEIWDESGGPGTMRFARPGTLVIHNKENVLMEVLELLETYRTALRASRPRDRKAVDPQELITVYYRLHANVAGDLASLLPKLVQPESWKSDSQSEARGEIVLAASPPDLLSGKGRIIRASSAKNLENAYAAVVSRAVLIIRQTRAIHDEIAQIIGRIESGDASKGAAGGGGRGGGGRGGGFGGGIFSIPPARLRESRR